MQLWVKNGVPKAPQNGSYLVILPGPFWGPKNLSHSHVYRERDCKFVVKGVGFVQGNVLTTNMKLKYK